MSSSRESVWEYPRPPRVEVSKRHIRVLFDGRTVAATNRALRILETSHPPTYYIPREDVAEERLRGNDRRTICEWKARARYFDVGGPFEGGPGTQGW